MNHQAHTKLLADLNLNAGERAHRELHRNLAQRFFRMSYRAQVVADEAAKEGDKQTAAYFSKWAVECNDKAERHLHVSVGGQS